MAHSKFKTRDARRLYTALKNERKRQALIWNEASAKRESAKAEKRRKRLVRQLLG